MRFDWLVRHELQEARGWPAVMDEGGLVVDAREPLAPIRSWQEAYACLACELDAFLQAASRHEANPELLRRLVLLGALAQRTAEDLGLVERS